MTEQHTSPPIVSCREIVGNVRFWVDSNEKDQLLTEGVQMIWQLAVPVDDMSVYPSATGPEG